MNYASDMRTFVYRLSLWSAESRRIPVITGIMFDGRDGAGVVAQIRRARQFSEHFAAFAYNALFDRFDTAGLPLQDGKRTARRTLRARVAAEINQRCATAF